MANYKLTPSFPNDNPFDSIRRFDENGNEYWLARELMPLLGYIQWRNFNRIVKRAFLACSNIQNDATMHFWATAANNGGRNKDDWKLSRFACYLIAMNGNPEKEEVASAQYYFAIKTREAETVVPAQSEHLKELELQLEIEKNKTKQIEAQEKFFERSNEIYKLHGVQVTAFLRGDEDSVVEVEKPMIEIINKKDNSKYRGQTLKQVTEYAKQKYGVQFKTGKELKDFLECHKKDHLIDKIQRTVVVDYVPENNLKEVYQFLEKTRQQKLLGE